MKAFNRNFSKHPRAIGEQLDLDSVGADRFRNRLNQPNSYQALFGGQVVAQALAAADLTVDAERPVHSLHAYFLRGGDADHAIEFDVQRVRDGRRFSTRRVSAVQQGRLLLTLDSSYCVAMPGVEHQHPAEFPFDPEHALDSDALVETAPAKSQQLLRDFFAHYPIDVRFPSPVGFTSRAPVAKRHFWLRPLDMPSSDDERLHREVLAYMSDFLFAGTPLANHTLAIPGPHLALASLDHAMWFHRPVRCDDWLLFETDSPSARASLGLTRGLIYDRAGNLVATVAQEALQTIYEAVLDD